MMPLVRGARITLIVLALTVVGFGCGGGGTTSPSTSSATSSASAASSAAEAERATVNKAFFFAGFKVTVDEASVDPTAGSGELSLAVKMANQGDNPQAFADITLVVTSNGNSYPAAEQQDLPEVPGKSTGKGDLVFPVDKEFNLDDAVLTVGNPANNQAVVPLGKAGKLVDLAPRSVTVAGRAVADVIQVDVDGGEIRADIPGKHKQVEKGHLALTLDFSATFNSDFSGGYAFTHDNLALRLPDGTTIGPDDGPIELIQPRTTLRDVQVRFIIDDPAAGQYALVAIQDVGTPTRGEFLFTITT
jgi:hypothetical protein